MLDYHNLEFSSTNKNIYFNDEKAVKVTQFNLPKKFDSDLLVSRFKVNIFEVR